MYQLRAQGFSSYEIREQLPQHFPQLTDDLPDPRTIQRWISDPQAAALVSQDAARLRASYVTGAADVVPQMLERIGTAVLAGKTGEARDLSQALAAVTRGIVADKLEAAVSSPDAPDELTQLLKRHGVVMSAASSSETPSADQNRSA